MTTEPEICFRIMTIGDSGVGKTSILRRFVDNKFQKNHLATIGVDFKTKVINIDNQEIRLKIWDTAGQERFHTITTQYYKNADGVILVYDVTDSASYSKVREWVGSIGTNTQQNNIGIILLGNKCDLEARTVTPDMGNQIAQELNMTYFETSALTGQGINEAFEYLTRVIMQKKGIGGFNNYGAGVPMKMNKEDNDCCCYIF